MSSFEEKDSVVLNNFRAKDEELFNTLEKRVAHIAERIELFSNEMSENNALDYGSFCDRSDCKIGAADDFIDENKEYINGIFDKVKTYDKIKYAEMLSKKDSRALFSENEDAGNDSSKVIYLKNSLADVAYSAFSGVIKNARVVYAESFSEVCEEVYYSRVPFCILPLENSDDGRMVSFRNLIRKYDLKIVMTCNVESAIEKVTKFALLKREISDMKCPSAMNGGEYLELELNLGNERNLHCVLEAAIIFGYTLCKVDSFPVQYSEKEYYFNIVFEGKGNLDAFICWLEFEVQRYDVIGIYTHLKL